jgi:hypothetical protein
VAHEADVIRRTWRQRVLERRTASAQLLEPRGGVAADPPAALRGLLEQLHLGLGDRVEILRHAAVRGEDEQLARRAVGKQDRRAEHIRVEDQQPHRPSLVGR